MQQSIRRLTSDDVGEVARLEAEARSAMLSQRGGGAHLAEVPAVGDWDTLVADHNHAVWVALVDDVPVGYLELLIAGDVAELRQVYVHPQARGLGLGAELLSAAVEEGRERGCARLEGTALPGDRETKNLFERAGIKARKIVMSTTL